MNKYRKTSIVISISIKADLKDAAMYAALKRNKKNLSAYVCDLIATDVALLRTEERQVTRILEDHYDIDDNQD